MKPNEVMVKDFGNLNSEIYQWMLNNCDFLMKINIANMTDYICNQWCETQRV